MSRSYHLRRMHLPGFVRPAALAIFAAAPFTLPAQAPALSPTDAARVAISQWVDLQSRIATARSSWALEKDIAQNRIRLFEEELVRLKETIDEASQAATTAEQRRGELEAELATVRSGTVPVDQRIARYEATARALRSQLPAPLSTRLDQLYSRIPAENARNITLDLSNRLVTVVGIFSEVEKFNRAVTVVPGSRALDNGTRVSVKEMYLGLAIAYAANEEGTLGWIGRPGPEGWVWEANNAVASNISRSIGMYERTITPPAYVPLPVQIN